MFARFLRRPSASVTTRRRTKRHLAVETLEGRQLMSLGAEFTVNNYAQGFKWQPDTASSSNASTVAVWTDFKRDYYSSTSYFTESDVHAQRFSASGAKLGPEMVVAGKVGINEDDPHVAMDAAGDFVVSWTEAETSGDTNVLAQKFSPAGVPVGGLVQVGVGTFQEHSSDVAMDAKGNFVVAYTRDTNDNNPDVFAKRYNASSQLLGVITVADSPKAESSPSIAMTPDGRFDISYEYQANPAEPETGEYIYVSRYSAAGNFVGLNVVATSTPEAPAPSIAIDNSGNAVVAYNTTTKNFINKSEHIYNYNIYATRISGAGVASSPIHVHEPSSDGEDSGPSIALAPTGGTFVVAYQNAYGVEVSEVNSANTIVTTAGAGVGRWFAAVSINAADQFFVVYTSTPVVDFDSNSNILGRLGTL